MNTAGLKSIASDWLLPDIIGIVGEYAKTVDYRFSDQQEGGGGVIRNHNNRTATAETTIIRVWSINNLWQIGRPLTYTVVARREIGSGHRSEIVIGIGNSETDRSYSIDMLQKNKTCAVGLQFLFDLHYHWSNLSVNYETKIYDVSQTSTVRIDIEGVWFRQSESDDPPCGALTTQHYGLRPWTGVPDRSTIRSLSTVRFVVDGVECKCLQNVPDVESLVPYAQIFNASVTVDDG